MSEPRLGIGFSELTSLSDGEDLRELCALPLSFSWTLGRGVMIWRMRPVISFAKAGYTIGLLSSVISLDAEEDIDVVLSLAQDCATVPHNLYHREYNSHRQVYLE
jgi:hypothetical protein